MPRSCAIRGFTLLVFLIAACAFFPGPPLWARQAQAPAKLLLDVDLSTYKAELDRISDGIKDRADIPQLRQSLPRIWHVRASDGAVDVSTVWLASELLKLEQEPPKYDVIASGVRSQLAAMRKSATELEAALQQPSSPGAREHLDKILDRREFAGERGPSQMELFQARMARWIERQLFRLLSRLHLGAQAGNAVSWGIVAIAFFALCYWIVQNLAGRSRLQQASPEAAARWNDSRAWAQDALAAAERGDYREAVHCAYWAAIVRLETRGILKSDRARTPRESLRLLDPHPREQKLLREFTSLFELVWYGYRPASANDWSNARTHMENMGCLTGSTAAIANS
jgi:hypothetical protein